MATLALPRGTGTLRVTSALGVVQIFAWGSSYYLLSVLAAPLAADTGWPLPWIFGGLTLGLLVAGLASPRVGARIGRDGGRVVLATGCALMAAGLAMLGAAGSLAMFIAGWAVLGLGMGAGLYDAAFAALGRLYGAAARPAITQLTLWGGFASTVCWPISAFLVAQLGWRGTCFAYAGVMLGLCLPLVLVALPAAPRKAADAAPAPAAAPVVLHGRDRAVFLLLCAIMTIGGAIVSVLSVHLLTLLQAQGLTLAEAVGVGMVLGPAQVAARLIEMAGGGRHDALWTLAAAVVMMAFGLFMLMFGWVWPGVALALYGAGTGVYSIARGTVPLSLFGPARYAQLIGRVARPNLMAQALAPSAAAFLMAHSGPAAMLHTLAGLTLVNVAVLALLARAARGGDGTGVGSPRH
ncbi:MFS transporter [Azorhizobium doebereinerae]|uniref:MFS transporter n=1 Tax=Azorhizobium doebereinerae TaxID=281091 RepID=UPI0004273D7A|nr:MFS transporter [Azorhizobium doebereinerae]